MSRYRPLGLALGLLALPLAAASSAQQGQPGRFREVFLQLDGNADTVLERDEIPESGREAFDRLLKRGDANKNGKLEADELRALGQKLSALETPAGAIARFSAMDKDKDGKVGKDEFTGAPPRFKQIDADKDGALSREEIASFFGSQAGEPAKETPKPKDEPARPKAEPAATPLARFKALDKDGDGRLSKDEFPRPKVFERLDANADGFLTPAEVAKFKKL
jgi:Ca2+-binding EF-hand superfamily protein